jgi:hypothetical protein
MCVEGFKVHGLLKHFQLLIFKPCPKLDFLPLIQMRLFSLKTMLVVCFIQFVDGAK